MDVFALLRKEIKESEVIWIDINERLPTINLEVMVYIENLHLNKMEVKQNVWFLLFTGKFYDQKTQLEISDVKHWFPQDWKTQRWSTLDKPIVNCQWIDVNDALPDRFGRYLVTDGVEIEIMRFFGKHKNEPEWSSDNCNTLDVTHWSLLPELPKDEKENK